MKYFYKDRLFYAAMMFLASAVGSTPVTIAFAATFIALSIRPEASVQGERKE